MRWLPAQDDARVHGLVVEYLQGTPLSWHRDIPDFEAIASASLGWPVELRFRPYPPGPDSHLRALRVQVEPRSIYAMQGEARWAWQYCVMLKEVLRWSVTCRTRCRT